MRFLLVYAFELAGSLVNISIATILIFDFRLLSLNIFVNIMVN